MNFVEKAKLQPEEVYKRPQDVMDDQQLSNQDKIDILMNWRDEMNRLIESDGENMENLDHRDDQTGARLQSINNLLEELNQL